MSFKSELFTIEMLVTITIVNSLIVILAGLSMIVAPVPTDSVVFIIVGVSVQLIYVAAFVHTYLHKVRNEQNARAQAWRESMRTR